MRISDWSSDVCSSDLFGAGVADIAGIDEYGRDAGVYKGGFQRSDARHFKIDDQLAGGKHGTARAVFFGGGVHEFKLHFGEIGRATGRDRVCQYGEISVGAGAFKKQKNTD